MKKGITILLLMVLISCGSEPALESPKNNTDYKNIIGNPVKIDKLEVAQYDFPEEMNWKDAIKECENLGGGWRLPTKNELNILYQNQDKIRGFTKVLHWSMTEFTNDYAYTQNFSDGNTSTVYLKDSKFFVRAIRPL